MNLIAFPIRILFSSLIIICYIKSKKFRKKPGDFFIMIAINNVLEGFAFIITEWIIGWGTLKMKFHNSFSFC